MTGSNTGPEEKLRDPSAPLAEIIVTLPVTGRFHYLIPPHLAGWLRVGHRVLVPFGGRRATGFVTALDTEPPGGRAGLKLKPIAALLDDEPLLSADLMAIVAFASEYYLAPAGEVLRVALPPGITAASVVRLRATAAGKLATLDAAWRDANGRALKKRERELLAAAVKASGVRRTPKLRDAAERLVELGLVSAIEKVAAKSEHDGEIELFVLRAAAGPTSKRASARKRILELLSAGPSTESALAEAYATAETERPSTEALRRALRKLEKEGAIEKTRVPKASLDAAHAAHRPPELVRVDAEASGPPLTSAQADALTPIVEAITAPHRAAFLLRGVTGSGKTEVYLRAIAEARARSRGAIVLVPEIALTAQLEGRFRSRFGDDVVVLHSALSDKERRRRWEVLRSGRAGIALGPRSAVWAPVGALSVVVVDEEHDPSFKQHNDLRYNGRDLALLRAHRANGVAILGSATPSLETRQQAISGRLVELRLPERVLGRPMPEVKLVDLAEEQRAMGGEMPLLSRPLEDALREVIGRGEQAIIFLNRRGFNTVVVCETCGEARTCPDCAVSLTHHKARGLLLCHYCGHQEPLQLPCRRCQGLAMKPFGAGTERVAEEIRKTVPGVRVLRLDRDVVQKADAIEETLEQFKTGAADVLVGTQMVAKGHDFPGVTLVGIICADTSLAFPDFRAAERTFQLMTQVAGRAGRAERPGRVVVQTFQPEHYALTCALHHDDQRFFQIESDSRRRASYPPFARMGVIRVESTDLSAAQAIARRAAELATRAGRSVEGFRVRGPVPAPIERIKGSFRQILLLLAPTPAKLVAAMRAVKDQLEPVPRRVSLIFDVDPVDLL